VLVFLPGAADIRRAQESCAPLARRHGLLVLPLHGELPAAEQDAAVRPGPARKVVLATNVAETSVTIEGVAFVVDSGLARVATHSPWSGLPTLNLARVSQASAVQRAGRAGRTRAGRALRLYTAHDFALRPPHEEPEVRRADLAGAALELHAAGFRDLKGFGWFDEPPAPALDAAEELLLRLGAVEQGGALTKTARRCCVCRFTRDWRASWSRRTHAAQDARDARSPRSSASATSARAKSSQTHASDAATPSNTALRTCSNCSTSWPRLRARTSPRRACARSA
jgi:HrpA-like RNA helicase